MSELSTYNPKFVPEPFGLQNNGVLCYLNSLVQALMSCSAFNEFLIKNRKQYEQNGIVREYLKLFLGQNNVEQAFSFLRELIMTRKKNNEYYNLSFGNQEDANEGLILLLDSIGGGIEKLFHTRYKCRIICQKCKKITRPGSKNFEEPNEIIIDLSDNALDISTKKEIEDYIRKNIQIPSFYKCESCNVQNTEKEQNIFQVYSLVRISEIIVILFKKYYRKKQIYFPDTLEFESKSGALKYKVVAQIEHYGSMQSGHYIARSLRTLLEAGKKINNIYEFNDTNISTSQFGPTLNTYMVFYHLVKK